MKVDYKWKNTFKHIPKDENEVCKYFYRKIFNFKRGSVKVKDYYKVFQLFNFNCK